MSFLKSKHSGWTWDLKRTPFTGGGGGGGPSSTKTETSNIPEYARPYVENMLGATQNQLFTMGGGTPGKPATYDSEGNMLTAEVAGTPDNQITGFKPYQPYSTNVNDYFAGPSPLQQQSYQGMANMKVAPQIGEGSVMANQGGAGLMASAVPAMGMAGQAAMSGQNYQNMATNPQSMQAYMSPYMQNVVDYQKGQALRDYQKGQPMMQAQAVGQGAFGGNRMALQQSEAQRGLMSQLQGIEASGAQNAFQNAQQAQQYGANLGLQGLQTGLQGIGTAQAGLSGGLNAANTLGNLGQNQYGQQMGILQGQNQFGQQQQQMEQAKINQSVSDYATQQQYPYMQLGMMSNMLRGLPMQSTSTQMYQNPSAISQLGGLAATGLGAYGAAGGFRAKKGGEIKVKNYDVGGSVKADLAAMDIPHLKQVIATSPSKEIRDDAKEILVQKEMAAQAEQPQQPMGLAAAPAPNMDGMATLAGGGIVAFATGKSVKDPDIGGFENTKKYITGLEEMGFGKPTEEQQMIREDIAAQREHAKDAQDQNFWRALMTGGAKAMASTSNNPFVGFGEGIQEGVGTYAKGEKDYADMLKGLRSGEIDLAKLNSTDRQNLMHYAITGATSEAATAERARSNELIAKERAADRALTQKQGDESKYNTAITARAKLLIGNAVAPTEQQVQEAYNTAKRQIDEESKAGRPKKGSADVAAPTGGGTLDLPKGVIVKKVG